METIANDAGVSSELAARLDENCPNWQEEMLTSLGSTRRLTGVDYVVRMRKTLLAL
ncbi:hypothetical protein [Pirellulimonas nuda]|uniref:hypothetical protein n=1 Tax=Pirellulimonas nuda TaxID=2528009 RepID=UPI0018D3AA1F|nr:hypothetical protein [Pirellulimonas nuda]